VRIEPGRLPMTLVGFGWLISRQVQPLNRARPGDQATFMLEDTNCEPKLQRVSSG
jgi:hypothetical protein